tara:strand:- start:126 stop:299 length:174 start_codon:yes stop_codon:yes gene_type:complete
MRDFGNEEETRNVRRSNGEALAWGIVFPIFYYVFFFKISLSLSLFEYPFFVRPVMRV